MLLLCFSSSIEASDLDEPETQDEELKSDDFLTCSGLITLAAISYTHYSGNLFKVST